MRAHRIIFPVLSFSVFAAAAAAKTHVVRPDPCPAYADAPLLIDIGDGETVELVPESQMAREVLVLYPVRASGWASARILARFDLEGAPGRGGRPACDRRR